MKVTFLFLLLIFSFNIYAQQKQDQKFNFNFENITAEAKYPDGWFMWGTDYTLNIDSAVKHDGNVSIRIEPVNIVKPGTFGCIAYQLPVNFTGKRIRLKGYMKLENVADGSAGLLLRVDGKNSVLQFDNMEQRNIKGTVGWQEYSTELPLDPEARTIYVGAILMGSGKLWVDNFNLLIDDTDISQVETIAPKIFKAELDKEYDNGSNIVIDNPDETAVNNLYILGKVWGFLKYYHPKIAEGEYNWDYELFRIIPKILNASPDSKRNEVLLNWINSLGSVNEINEDKLSDQKSVKLYPDIDWINDRNLINDELSVKLAEIRDAKRSKEQYYIGFYEGIHNPNFKNENTYEYVIMDDGYRLLSLFRYWNMIQYFFPNRHLIGEDWNLILKEFIPKFINERTDLGYHLNTQQLIARIHDTHANIWGNKTMEDYKGINVARPIASFIQGSAIITSYYPFKAGSHENTNDIQIGDEIISINRKSIPDIIKEKLPLTPASNYPTQLRDIAQDLFRTNDTLLAVEIKREGKTRIEYLKCYKFLEYDMEKYYNPRKPCWRLINKDIGYIYPATISNDSLPTIMDKFKDTKGIVIDFRCYPSDFIVFTFGKYLHPSPTPFVKFSLGSSEYPGMFTLSDFPLMVGMTNADYYKGKIIIIVNEITQSSAEYTSLSLRTAPNALVIGSTTAGADGNVSEIFLPGGIRTMISGIGVITPDGRETQRIGIVPDVEVKPTIKGIQKRKDEPLLKAIEMIEK